MNDVVGYIFHELASSEIAIKNINKALKSQVHTNRSFVVFAICTTACAAVMKKRLDDQGKTIRQLKDKIAALEARKENYEL
jgi:ubiquinone biosynthesis protein UbiJ